MPSCHLQEVTSRTQLEQNGHHARWDAPYTVPTMASDTADALRTLLRCSRIGTPIATERIWDAMERTSGPRTRPQSRMAFSSAAADTINATRDMRGNMGNAPNMSPPHEMVSDIYDPLFDAYYGAPSEPFGGSWTSRYGMSPPPPPPRPPILAPPEASSPSHTLSNPLSDTVPLSPGPARERPPSHAERDTRRAFEGRSTRSTDFASYSARRRALHRNISRSQLEDRRERDHSPGLWDAEMEILEGEREVNSRSLQSETEPDVEIDVVSSQPPIRPLRRPMIRSLTTSSPLVPPDSVVSGRPSSSHRSSESQHPASFDYLRHRLEAYPRRGSYGMTTDDLYSRAGPSSLSIRPPHTALLLTQGRSRSRSPMSPSGARGPPRPVRRLALRAPELEPPAHAESGYPRHSSLPPPDPSGALLGPSDGHEIFFARSPSPLPVTLTMAGEVTPPDPAHNSSSEDAGNSRTNEREDSLPPPIIQLMLPRAATPEFA